MPAGTPNGRTFRVRGKGSRKKDGTTGDLLATVQVQVPGTLNADARAAVEAYRAAGNEPSLRANLFTEAGRVMSDQAAVLRGARPRTPRSS